MSLFFSRRSLRPVVGGVAIVVIAGWYFWQRSQGPVIEGYEVTQQPLVVQVVASGEVRSESLARVGSEISGVVATRHVREGDQVKAGDVLLELHSEQQQAQVAESEAALQSLVSVTRPQATATLREADDALARATKELERRQALAAKSQVSQEELDLARSAEVRARAARDSAAARAKAVANGGSDEQQLQQRLAAARVQLARTSIRANVDGTVQTRNAEPGDVVQPGATLFEIARIDSREIIVPVDEKIFAGVKLGQHATVIADAYPARSLAATVSFIAPAVDSARGTVDVHLQIDRPDSQPDSADFLLQGMTVTATIVTEQRESVLVIPNDALRDNDASGKASVLRVANNTVERVAISTGLQGLVASEVTSGLGAGDIVLKSDAEPGQHVRVQLPDSITQD